MAVKSKARHGLTLRAIKREIKEGRDVAYWLDKAYQHLDSGLFTEDDIAEVEELAQKYYDSIDDQSDGADDTSTIDPNIPTTNGGAEDQMTSGSLSGDSATTGKE